MSLPHTQVEPLEFRRLFAIDVFPVDVPMLGTHLYVTATAKNDLIVVSKRYTQEQAAALTELGDDTAANALQLRINNVTTYSEIGSFQVLRIYGYNGHDNIRIDNSNGVLEFPVWIFAGAGNDTLTGGAMADKIHGDEGDDTIEGVGKGDTLFGDDGADLISGASGWDKVYGGAGDDILYGNRGDDQLFGEGGNDFLEGTTGNDTLDGGAENDTLFGNTGTDELTGGDGDDVLDGGEESDSLNGGTGNDSLVGGPADDDLFGDLGNDTLLGGEGNDDFDKDLINFDTTDFDVFTDAGANGVYGPESLP